MSERRLKLMEIREMIRHIREHRSDRQIGKDLGVDRRTVKRYRQWAQEQGLLKGELPDHQSLLELLNGTMPEKMPPQNNSKAEPYRERIEKLLKEKVKVTAIYDRLLDRAEVVIIRGASYRAQGRTRLLEEVTPFKNNLNKLPDLHEKPSRKWRVVAEDYWRSVTEYRWSIYVWILTPLTNRNKRYNIAFVAYLIRQNRRVRHLLFKAT